MHGSSLGRFMENFRFDTWALPRKTGHDTQNLKRVYSLQIWCQMKTESLNFHDL